MISVDEEKMVVHYEEGDFGDGRAVRAYVGESTCARTQHAHEHRYEGFGKSEEQAKKHLADAIFR